MQEEANQPPTSPSAFEAQRLAGEGQRLTLEQLEKHLPLVRTTLKQLGHQLPPDIELETLLGKALLALVEAAEDRPVDSVGFNEYARLCIWRALTDYLLQSRCFLPVAWASLQRLSAATDEALRASVATKEGELEVLLSQPGAELRKALEQIASLRTILPQSILALAGDDYAGPLKRRLAGAICELPQREQLMVAMYYFEDRSFPEIAEILGISEQELHWAFSRATVLLRINLCRRSPRERAAEGN